MSEKTAITKKQKHNERKIAKKSNKPKKIEEKELQFLAKILELR